MANQAASIADATRQAGMNVLFIPVDDLRPQLRCYGCDYVLSPNIDALANDGLLLERAYCQQAICGPSRASVLSGCRPDTTTVYGLKTPLREAMPDVLSLPQQFRNHGYETMSVGKVYHHQKDDLEGWSSDPVQTKGDWLGRGYLTDEAIEQMAICEKENDQSNHFRRGLGPAFEAADVDDNAYPDGADATRAIAELERLKDQRFFLAVGFHKPHLPFNAPKRYWDLYDPQQLPLAPNPFMPEGATPFTFEDFGELRGYFGLPNEGPVPDELARKLIHGYCACVSYMDAQLGRVIAKLEELGLRDNTMIMLWGDHGWKLGEHARWTKHSNAEIDTRAPLIVSVPAMRGKGCKSKALVEFVDMYPTLCDLAGLPVPDHCEGTSFAPLLDEPDRPWKTGAFSQYPRRGNVMGYTIRTDRYRYTEWLDRETRNVQAREFYDHQSDAQENINAIANPQHAQAIEQLANQLHAGWQAAKP